MSNPVLPDLSGATADALSATTDAGTGIKHLSALADDTTTPTHFQRLMQQADHIFELLGRFGGATIHLSGLNVGVYACEYEIAATERSFPGAATQALTASATNYLYLDNDQTLKISTTAWPAGAHFRLAKAITNGSTVTSLTDVRMQNCQRGGNAWYSIAAAADVDFGNFLAKNLAGVILKDTTTLTLASDVITPTQELHLVDTQAAAAADDLVTLTADAAKIGRKVILRCVNAARVVTVKSTGNIKLIDGDCVLDSTSKNIELLQDTATTWMELGRNVNSPTKLLFDLNCDGKKLKDAGKLSLKFGGAINISSGEITTTHSNHVLVPEAGNADDLDKINFGASVAGELLLLSPQSSLHVITIRDANLSGGNIVLGVAGSTLVLSGALEWVLLFDIGGVFLEVARSRWKLSHLVGTGTVLPWPGNWRVGGTIANNTILFDGLCTFPFTVRRAKGRVVTAPVTNPCVVHVKKNGSTIFASDAAAISIAAGANSDTSDLVSVSFAVDDRLTIEATIGSSAADLSVMLEAYMTAQAQP